MKKFSLYSICRRCLWVLSIATVAFILLLNLVYNATVSYDAKEKFSCEFNIVPSLIFLLIIVALPFFYSGAKSALCKIDEKKLFRLFTLIYCVMAIYLIINVDKSIRADASNVFRAAKSFALGDYSALKNSGYIGRYPHQTGLMFYDGLLQKLCPFPVISFIANFIFVIGINRLALSISSALFKSKEVTIFTTVIAFAFLPQFFFILFAYGLTPGFFFMMLGFYNAIRYIQEKRMVNAVFTGIGMGIASLFKQNFLIGGIAIAIFFLLSIFKSFKENKKEAIKMLGVLIFVVVFMFVPSHLVKTYYQAKSDVMLDQGSPAILWVAMGTDIDNNYRAPGWYSGFNWSTYNKSGYNNEIASEMGMEKLKDNIEKIKKEPSRAAYFFYLKTISQWCEPMFQSVWSGPLEDCGQKTHTPLLQSIYTGGEYEKVIATFSKLIVVIILAFTLAFLIFAFDKYDGWEIVLMFLIGGLVFHTVWEGKSQYTYPYIFALSPFACFGIKAVSDKIESLTERKEKKKEDGK